MAAGAFVVSATSVFPVQMPILEGEVKQRYEERHADSPRYELYNDTGGTSHGGTSGMQQGYGIEEDAPQDVPTFFHRPEHDVESIYWSMVSVLLRVRPTNFPKSQYVEGILAATWKALDSHQIHDGKHLNDSRQPILDCPIKKWEGLFPAEMKDVARLMSKISRQVCAEYGLWKWPEGQYREDHLHEALQRLIFEYLFTHRDKDIALDPSSLRSKIIRPKEPRLQVTQWDCI